jgi:hypothetical protein
MAANVRSALRHRFFMSAIQLCVLLKPPVNAVAQTNGSNSVLILESTNNIYGMGGKDSQLLVRLKQDGTVEWDEPVLQKPLGREYKLRVASIPREQVTSISKRIAALNKVSFPAKMGPYRSYTDTSVELQVRILTSSGSVAFSVLNPWLCTLPSCSMGKSKPIPEDVKVVICEVSKLRAQLAGEPTDPICKAK